MKATTRAVVSALVRAPLNSLREMVSEEVDSDKKYLFCMAHPDDEILVAGAGGTLVNSSANTIAANKGAILRFIHNTDSLSGTYLVYIINLVN